MRFCCAFDCIPIPELRMILDHPPCIHHVSIVPMEGMAGLACSVDCERVVQIGEVNDHAHGGQPIYLVGIVFFIRGSNLPARYRNRTAIE